MLQRQNRIIVGILVVTGIAVIAFKDNYGWQVTSLIIGLVSAIFSILHFDTKNENKHAEQLTKLAKRSEKQVNDAVSKMNHLIEVIPSALVYVNQEGNFDVTNHKFREILGQEALNVYDTTIDGDLRQLLLDAFLNEKQFIRQMNFKGVDYQVLSIPVIKKDRYIGCMLIFQDITRLLEGEKMQKRFIADASHELRTPITAIKGMSEILNRQEFDDDKARDEFLAQIQIEASRLEQIVEDLMLQSRLSAKQVYLEKTRFNLKQFFDGLMYEKRQELHQSNIRVVLNCPSDLVIEADHFRLSQVFLNLFNNAINYAKNEEIRINCTVTSRECVIEFCDTGKGIDPKILPHIFERFYRGDEGRDRDSGGSGLGLAISKSIIEAHDGTIVVDSKINNGTCFTVTLKQDF